MRWKEFFFGKKTEHKELAEITMGEKLPWADYQQLGDYVLPKLTPDAFEVVIALTDLTEVERQALADGKMQIGIVDTQGGPLVVMVFGEEFRCDFHLNLQRMKADMRENWLKEKTEKFVIYILEGKDARLKAMRVVEYSNMKELRERMRIQLNMKKEEIDQKVLEFKRCQEEERIYTSCTCVDDIE